jgi:choline kinase
MDSKTIGHIKKFTPLLLVAGYGSRIAEITDNPKCLLEVGGKTILDRHFETWIKLGFKKSIVVLGYKEEMLRKHLKKYDGQIEISYVINEDYRNLGNTYSLKIGLDVANQGILIFDADLVYDLQILKDFVADPAENQILIGKASLNDIECAKTLVDNDNFARLTVDKRVVSAEELKSYSFAGEAIGILKFSKEVTASLLLAANEFLSYKENQIKNWEHLMNIFLLKHQVGIHNLTNEKWIEIDTPEDYQAAQKIFTGAIL